MRDLETQRRGWVLSFISELGSDWVHLVRRPLLGILYQHRMLMVSMDQLVEQQLAGEAKYLEKTCPNGTLSTTNSTWPYFRSNPGRRGGKPQLWHSHGGWVGNWYCFVFTGSNVVVRIIYSLFSSVAQVEYREKPQIKPWPLPSTFFPINYSLYYSCYKERR
jgi:hypothetical protein